MKKIDGYEFTEFGEWLRNCCTDKVAIAFFGDSDQIYQTYFDQSGKYIGELYRDSDSLYISDESGEFNYLHLADVPWEKILKNL